MSVVAQWIKMLDASNNNIYDEAIQHYRKQREQLEEYIDSSVSNQAGEFKSKVLNEFAEDIQNLGVKTWPATYDFLSKLGEKIAQKLLGDNQALSFLANEQQNKYSEISQEAKEALNHFIDTHYSAQAIKNFITRELKKFNFTTGKEGLDMADIMSWVRGYCRTAILQQTKNPQFKPPSTLQGYFKEAAILKATQNLASKLDKKIQVQHLGPKNKPEDILLSFIPSNIDTTISIAEPIEVGMQVKSYTVPLELEKVKAMKKNYIYIRSVQNEFDEYKQYAESKELGFMIAYVAQNLTSIMGKNNAMWVTGNTLHWTHELIANLKAAQYRAVFCKKYGDTNPYFGD